MVLNKEFEELTIEEQVESNGGFWPEVVAGAEAACEAVGAVAGVGATGGAIIIVAGVAAVGAGIYAGTR